MIEYACGHCGHRFESEENDALECPSCFWSTSLRKEGTSPNKVSNINLNRKNSAEIKNRYKKTKQDLQIMTTDFHSKIYTLVTQKK